MSIDNIPIIDTILFLKEIKHFQKPTYVRWILWIWSSLHIGFGELSNANESSSSCESPCGVVGFKISLGGFICWNCDGGLKPCLKLSKFSPSYLKHEIFLGLLRKNLELRTINKAIMFWSSIIVAFLNVETTMLTVACACSHKTNSLSFNCFCCSFVTYDLWGLLKLEPP